MNERKKLRIVPMTLSDANQVVENIHRHHGAAMALSPSFAIGCVVDEDPMASSCEGRLCGAAVSGRPINRHNDDGATIEVLRTATDGTPNAPSALLRGCVRVASAMGFGRVITYTLDSETGESLRGAAFKDAGYAEKTKWHRDYPSNQTKNRGNYRDHADMRKIRWEVFIRDVLPFDLALADAPAANEGQLTFLEVA